jgi:hypothetical protein
MDALLCRGVQGSLPQDGNGKRDKLGKLGKLGKHGKHGKHGGFGTCRT